MIYLDNKSLVKYFQATARKYSLEVNGILTESSDRFVVEGISFLSKKELEAVDKCYDSVLTDLTRNEFRGMYSPTESTKRNLSRLIRNKRTIRGVLHGHTLDEYINPFFGRSFNTVRRRLSFQDIPEFDSIVKPVAKLPVYYGLLLVPCPPMIQTIQKQLKERLILFEGGRTEIPYEIKN